MCIICIDLERDKLSTFEARRNFGEMRKSLGEHASEVEEIISKREINEMLQEFLKDIAEMEGGSCDAGSNNTK